MRGAATFAAASVMLVVHVARAQESTSDAEPLAVDYAAPSGCPAASSFFGEITARTPRARAPRVGERARVLHVRVARRGEGHVGTLAIEDTSGTGSAREVSGGTCEEVVGALALVAALAVDPRASVAPRPPPSAAATPTAATAAAAPPAEGGPPASSASPPGASSSPSEAPDGAPAPAPAPPAPPATERDRAAPKQAEEPHDARPRRLHIAVGAAGEIAMIADAVASIRVFGDLDLTRGAGDRDLFSPSLRLAVARSLDRDVSATVAGATLRWTQAALDVCPIRFAIAEGLGLRPCVAASAGAIEADAIQSRTRPWATLGAHGRLVWAPAGALEIELEGGAIAPLYRESFYFEPNVPVYEAPPVAFVGRIGVALRFP